MKRTTKNSIKALLLQEEMKAEVNIARIKVVLFGLLTLSQFVEALFMNKPFSQEAFPVLIVFFISILMYLDIYFLKTNPKYHKFFGPYNKYVIISFDILIVSFLLFYIFKNIFHSEQPLLSYNTYHPFLFAFYMFLAIAYIMLDIFRFSIVSSFYLGLLIILSYITVNKLLIDELTIPEKTVDFSDIFFTIFFVSIVIIISCLSALISSRIRNIVVLSKKQENLQRFLPETVAHEFLNSKEDFNLDGQRKRVTILFADIRNFTTLSEDAQPEEVVQFLNIFLEEMIASIFKYQGTLDKFLGDGIMAIFGAPVELENSAENAVNAAVDMLDRLKSFNEKNRDIFGSDISIGIGIHTGEVVLGGIGTDRRMDFTAIGDAVNTASRLQGITKNYQTPIIFSEDTRDLIKTKIESHVLDKVQLRGKHSEIQIYQLGNVIQ